LSSKKGLLMKKKDIEHFTEKLKAWKDELVLEATRTVDGMTEEKAQFADPTDRASMETDRNFLLRIRDRERRLITKIDRALGRIEDGSFGLCEACGEDIEVKRLDARPVATLCIECKTLQEEEEKLNK
ncbi:MAG: RNA polymerase-binding protein DksA, partial [bacterium]|nr:RNA polymerase-binding protein DksA [bacterium]